MVIITSPPAFHAAQAVAAARAGKAALVEKPMAQNVAECRQMLNACALHRVPLAVVSQHRFRDSPRTAKAIVDAGTIGRLNMIRVIGPEIGWWDSKAAQDEWKLDESQQPAYASWGAHACDLVRWFLADEPDLTYALVTTYTDEPPRGRTAVATYRFTGGAIVDIWMSYDVPPPGLGSGLQLLLIGSRGMIELDCYGTVRVGTEDGWRVAFEQEAFHPHDPESPARLAAYQRQLFDFARAVDDPQHTPLVDGIEGTKTTLMLDAALLAARTERAVDWKTWPPSEIVVPLVDTNAPKAV
jgi:predicted dehydrogenase